MKRFLFALILLVSVSLGVHAQEGFPSYLQRNVFLLTSPGALKMGLYGFDNPALLTYVRQPDLYFTISDADYGPEKHLNHWGAFLGAPHFGFSVNHQSPGSSSVTDYRVSVAVGDRAFSSGFSYGWSGGDRSAYDRSSLVALGFLTRPVPQLSFGLTGLKALGAAGAEVDFDAAVRPFGTPAIALFGDYALHSGKSADMREWSAGLVSEVVSGVRLVGRYFSTKAFSIGLDLSLGWVGFNTQTAFTEGRKTDLYTTYGVRFGAYDRNVFDEKFGKDRSYLDIDLLGKVGYQRYQWFDGTKTLSSLLEMIDAAQHDDAVAGIAINTSGMEANREMLWEIRDKLSAFRATGKRVVIFMDRAGMGQYHFASVADRIVMDPLGGLSLTGFVLGRTYLKGLLEKVGVGYDELRFFKYKSAAETFTRDSMSDADREQWQALVDAFYRLAKDEISASRHFTPARFDSLVNQGTAYLPQQALALGLVDTLARWDAVKDVIARLEGKDKKRIGAGSLAAFQRPYDERWGEPPRIAIVYAIGTCDMDQGIRARQLSKDIKALVDDSRIRAIVLRVDSPGGDALASDYVAEALRKAKAKKPIIVSQGDVAASGGYWLSMYADTIVASPVTITGSIGVIGGWMYNKGFKEWLGLSTDKVKVGEHADLPFGFSLPLIGPVLPDRDLTPEERTQVQSTIISLYREFTSKVAAGRKMKTEQVDSVGQGRVWSGYDGRDRGLVDLLGGLDTAVKAAKVRAGIGEGEAVTFVEVPQPGLFSLQALLPKITGVDLAESPGPDPVLEQLKFRVRHNGEPIPMLPLGMMEMSR